MGSGFFPTRKNRVRAFTQQAKIGFGLFPNRQKFGRAFIRQPKIWLGFFPKDGTIHLLDEFVKLTGLMTETPATLIQEIEDYLRITAERDVFTSREIQDLLLDLRNLANIELN